ncbi:MAG: PIN domain-containing protein [Actinobacteria bacterium]|nr:PIN domain-containing protein [Actinomycetota bacterium]
MLCVDVNVLVAAFRADHPAHEAATEWLGSARVADETVVVLTEVAASFLRIVTNRRIWKSPSAIAEAVTFLEVLLASPVVHHLTPGQSRWRIFTEFLTAHAASGDAIPDALLAAAARDLNATLVSFDRGFSRYDTVSLLLL